MGDDPKDALRAQEDLVDAFMHDAKNSLTSIAANISFAQDVVGPQASDLRDALVDAAESASRLVRQIDDLVVLTRAQAGMEITKQDIDIGSVLESVTRRGVRWAESFGTNVRASIPKNLHVHGDADLLAHALSEIFDLAVRYAGSKATVEIGAEVEDGHTRMWVRHDGRPLDMNPRLTAWLGGSRRPLDIGFGLAVATAVADAHGGTLEVASTSKWSAEIVLKIPT